MDLREVLGSTKHHEKTEVIPWDKRDTAEPATADDTETTFCAARNNREETSGFTFSFFGAENETASIKEGTDAWVYKASFINVRNLEQIYFLASKLSLL